MREKNRSLRSCPIGVHGYYRMDAVLYNGRAWMLCYTIEGVHACYAVQQKDCVDAVLYNRRSVSLTVCTVG